MTVHDGVEWIHFPVDEPITLSAPACAVAVRVTELAIRRERRQLLALEMTFASDRAALVEAIGAMHKAGSPVESDRSDGSTDRVLVTVRFDAGSLDSLPSNVAVLKRGLRADPLCQLANWSLVSLGDPG